MTAPPARSWRNVRWALWAHGVFWFAEAVLGGVLGAVLVAESRGMPGWMLATVLAVCALLVLIGLRLCVYALRQVGAPAPVLAMGPDGFFDRRLCPVPIPWAEVAFVDVYYVRGVQVMFDLTPAGRARIRPFERFLARLVRLILLPGFSVVLLGVDARAIEVADAMRAWVAATRPMAGTPALGADRP